MKRHYSGPAEALLAVVEHDVLTRRRAAERLVETDTDTVLDELDVTGDVRLPVAHLRRAIE